MPKLERWERKAIGEVRRFENSAPQYITNQFNKGGRLLGNYLAKKFIKSTAPVVTGVLDVSDPEVINGKKFSEKVSTAQKLGYKVGAIVTVKAFDMAEDISDAYFTRNYFYPNGPDVAKATFSGQVAFDSELGRQMFNACGYEPKFDRVMREMHDSAAKAGQTLTDITWRKNVNPYIIRTSFMHELDSCLQSIREQHEKNPDIHNRQLMEHQMRLATEKLGEIFEKFTLDLANKTDYQEAPMSFLPQKAPTYEGMGLTETQLDLLANVSRHSLFAKGADLQKKLTAEVNKLPALTAEQALERCRNSLGKDVLTADGKTEPYRKGVDPAEDERRLITGVLNLRELKQQYQNRNFFSRYLTAAGRAERKAIQDMQKNICEKLDLEPEQIKTLVDLKTPLEENVDISKAMDIVLKPEPVKTFSDSVKDLSAGIDQVITEVVEVLPDVETVINTASNAYHATKEAISSAGEAVSDVASTVVETASNILTEAGNAVSSASNAVKNALDFSEDLKFDLDFDDDGLDADLFNRDQRPEPIKPEAPQPAPEEPEQKKEEPDQKEQEGAKEQGDSWGNTVWNGVSYAASFFNPFAYSVFGGGQQVDPLQHIQDQQKAVAKELSGKESLDGKECQAAFAKLLYYKTLELSVADGKLSAEGLTTALKDDSVKQNTDQIMKDSAFKKLDKLQWKKGMVKDIRTYLQRVSEDPTAVNEIHKDYLQKIAAAKDPNTPQVQQPQQPAMEQGIQNQAPEPPKQAPGPIGMG